LTGQRPFEGADYVAIISSILKDEPTPVTVLKPELPRDLGRLVRKCLQKDVGNRYQTAREVRNDLKEVKADVDAGTVLVDARTLPPPPKVEPPKSIPFWRRPVPIAAAAVLVTALATWFLTSSPEPPLRKYAFQSADFGNRLNGPAISPDGMMVAYTKGNRLWVRHLAEVEPRELADTDGAQRPFWAPDSKVIGYFVPSILGGRRGDQLRTVAVQSGSSTPVCTLPQGFLAGATWKATGDIVFGLTTGNNTSLYTVPAQGGIPQVFLQPDSTRGERGFFYPHVLPGGETLVFAVDMIDSAGALVVQDGDTRMMLVRHPGDALAFPIYSPTGHLVYQRGGWDVGIWAVPFDLRSRRKTGEPFLVAAQGDIPSVSSDGTLVYRSLSEGARQLVWVGRSGQIEGPIGQPQTNITNLALSSDGRRVVVTSTEQNNMDIWIHDADRGTKFRLTSTPEPKLYPIWNPAGDQVAFLSGVISYPNIYLKAADGSDEEKLLVTGPAGKWGLTAWRGQYLVYSARDEKNQLDLWYLPMTGNRSPSLFRQTPFQEISPALSPDSRYVAYASDESGRWEIYVRSFPDGRRQWLVSVNGGMAPRWSGQSNELFYVEGTAPSTVRALMVVPVRTTPEFEWGTPRPLFPFDQERSRFRLVGSLAGPTYDVPADGQRFVALQMQEEARTTFIVVENWAREFEKKR
ncbi:MAG: PD40 domain-containing protein, partial [Candidatus Latescibacteria bacterium]|nr:PD40 domain-containing protein [Candidatus Latescibacterota bacterium]